MMQDVYAVFNKPVPQDTSPFFMSVWERTSHIPNEAAGYIVSQIADEDRMPQNMGKAILRAWESWQANNPGRMVHINCEVCGGEGFFWVWECSGGIRRQFVSPCPACKHADYPIPTIRELEEQGYYVMPVGYKGGPMKFDEDNELGVLCPEKAYARPVKIPPLSCLNSSDSSRQRSLSDSEKEDVAYAHA